MSTFDLEDLDEDEFDKADVKSWKRLRKMSRSASAGSKENFLIVLTGGPCAGKTTALARLTTYLSQRGMRVFTVPEAATMLLSNGCSFDDCINDDKLVCFQGNLLQTQIHLENTFSELAQSTDKPSVVICDRGAMDGSAYVDASVWNKILARYNYDNVQLRDQRYNAVFHLVTAAQGAEQHYTLANNATRRETVAEACALDALTQKAWVGHPHLVVIDNSTNFEGKIQRLIAAASEMVGLPVTKRKCLKFLLKKTPDKIPVRYEKFDVWKVYLHTREGPGYSFVRKRAQGPVSCYGLTSVSYSEDGEKIELKRIITRREYLNFVENLGDPTRRVIKQRRISFLHETQYFDLYDYVNEDLCVLTCQVAPGGEFKLPSFIDMEREVTGEKEYSAYYLSQVGHS